MQGAPDAAALQVVRLVETTCENLQQQTELVKRNPDCDDEYQPAYKASVMVVTAVILPAAFPRAFPVILL